MGDWLQICPRVASTGGGAPRRSTESSPVTVRPLLITSFEYSTTPVRTLETDDDSGFEIQGAGFGALHNARAHLGESWVLRVRDAGCGVQDAGLRVQVAGFRVEGSEFRVESLGVKV